MTRTGTRTLRVIIQGNDREERERMEKREGRESLHHLEFHLRMPPPAGTKVERIYRAC